MKEISYTCDVCGITKETDGIVSYFVNANNEIRIEERIKEHDSNKHICRSCIGIIYTYLKEEIGRGSRERESIT